MKLSGILKLIVGAALLFFAGRLWAEENPISPCGDRPDLFIESPLQVPFDVMPKNLFVGRMAHFWVESKDGLTKVGVKQNFKTGHKEFACATLPRGLKRHFSLFAPALLDRTLGQKTGTTIWQFQTSLDEGRLGVWNQKTKLFTPEQFFAYAKKNGLQLQWSQMGTDDFRIRLQKVVGDFTMILVIDFDQITP